MLFIFFIFLLILILVPPIIAIVGKKADMMIKISWIYILLTSFFWCYYAGFSFISIFYTLIVIVLFLMSIFAVVSKKFTGLRKAVVLFAFIYALIAYISFIYTENTAFKAAIELASYYGGQTNIKNEGIKSIPPKDMTSYPNISKSLIGFSGNSVYFKACELRHWGHNSTITISFTKGRYIALQERYGYNVRTTIYIDTADNKYFIDHRSFMFSYYCRAIGEGKIKPDIKLEESFGRCPWEAMRAPY